MRPTPNGAANARMIQDALDGPARAAELGAGDWPIDRPILFRGQDQVLRGAGRTRTKLRPTGGFDAIVMGFPDQPLDPTDRPDLAGILDPATVPGAGLKAGFRTGPLKAGKARIAGFAGTYLDLGHLDRWELAPGYCLDLGVEQVATQPAGMSAIAGSSVGGVGQPVELALDPGGGVGYVLATFQGLGPRQYAFTHTPKLGVLRRYVIQWDAATAALTLWEDNVRVLRQVLPAGTTLACPEPAPFILGGSGTSYHLAGEWAGLQGDWLFAGCRLGWKPRYDDTLAGAPVRRDGHAVTDQSRFFEVAADLCALVDMAPPESDADRLIKVTARHRAQFAVTNRQFGRWADPTRAGLGQTTASRCEVADLGIAYTWLGSGNAIALWACTDSRFRRITVDGHPACSLGDQGGPAFCYKNTVEDLRGSGTDAVLNLRIWFASPIKDFVAIMAGREVGRFRDSHIDLRDPFFNGFPARPFWATDQVVGQYIYRAERSSLRMKGSIVDLESEPYGKEGGVVVDHGSSEGVQANMVTLEDCFFDNLPAGAAAIVLRQEPTKARDPAAVLTITGTEFRQHPGSGPAVDVRGDSWVGRIDARGHGPLVGPWITNNAAVPLRVTVDLPAATPAAP